MNEDYTFNIEESVDREGNTIFRTSVEHEGEEVGYEVFYSESESRDYVISKFPQAVEV